MQESNQHNATQDECIWNTNYFTSRKYFAWNLIEILHSSGWKYFSKSLNFRNPIVIVRNRAPQYYRNITIQLLTTLCSQFWFWRWSRFTEFSRYHFISISLNCFLGCGCVFQTSSPVDLSTKHLQCYYTARSGRVNFVLMLTHHASCKRCEVSLLSLV